MSPEAEKKHEEWTLFRRLREDAVERGMQDLAIAYGWSAIAAGRLVIAQQMDDMNL